MKKLYEILGDIVDSRDLIAAIDFWESIATLDDIAPDEKLEAEQALKELQDFCEPFQDYSGWSHGETLIEVDYFSEYVKELLKDCGYIPKNLPQWIAIDWEKTAENVAQDYMLENDYYMRNC